MSVAVAAQRLARPLPEDAGEPLLGALLLQLAQLVCCQWQHSSIQVKVSQVVTASAKFGERVRGWLGAAFC